MPTRLRSSLDLDLTGSTQRRTNGVVTASYVTTTAKQARSMTDVVVPGFRELIKAGKYVNNPCLFVQTLDYQEGSGLYTAVHKTNGTILTHGGGGCLSQATRISVPLSYGPLSLSLPAGWADKAVDAAKSSCLADVDSTPYSFAEDIAEWRETLRFLRRPLASLKDLSDSFARDVSKLRLRRKAIMRAKALSDVYLTYRFAFSPLVRTVNNLLQAYHDKPNRPVRRSARGKFTAVHSNAQNQERGVSGNRLYWRVSCEASSEVRAVIGYEVSNPVTDWRFKYGLRFKDIPETMWAIFPMSFMYDRVWNASNAIRGITNLADPTVSILGASVTSRTSVKRGSSFYNTIHSSYNSTVSPDEEVNTSFTYERTLWSPTVLDALPPITVGNLFNTSLKAADLLALVTQRLR